MAGAPWCTCVALALSGPQVYARVLRQLATGELDISATKDVHEVDMDKMEVADPLVASPSAAMSM